MSLDDWILALHVLSAFALVAGVILFWALIVVVRQTETAPGTARMGPLSALAEALVGLGAAGTLVLGIWLALSVGGYDLWDGWILAAIVLWGVTMALGSRTSAIYNRSAEKARELRAAGQTAPDQALVALNRNSHGLVLQTLTSIAVLLILLDMIFKPGA